MARFAGNIFTKARGSIGSNTFSEARDRQGKIQTARQRVIPLNPRTPSQVSARANFSNTLNIIRDLGPVYYQIDWNRSISKLPGYQSLFSVLQKSKSESAGIVTVDNPQPPVILGGLKSTNFGFSRVSAIELIINWSPAASGNQQASDELRGFIVPSPYNTGTPAGDRVFPFGLNQGAAIRSDGSVALEYSDLGPNPNDIYVFAWFQSQTLPSSQQAGRASIVLLN